MPFYRLSEMEMKLTSVARGESKTVAGELMKVGVVTYQMGKMPPPHFHPNEEQFVLMLEGKVRMVLGEEERIIGRGDMVHIPRNTRHGIGILEGPVTFFAAKSPVGTGDLDQDYQILDEPDEMLKRLSGAS